MLNLRNVRRAQRRIHEGENKDGSQAAHAEHLRYAEAELPRLVRLCTYSDEMRKVWRRIAIMPSQGSVDPALAICEHISLTLGRFSQIPKRLPAERKRSLLRVAKAIDDLLKTIESDSEAKAFLEIALMEYLGNRNLKMRIEDGEAASGHEFRDPSRTLDPSNFVAGEEGSLEDEPCRQKPWRQWSSFERYAWLYDEASMTGVPELLTFCRDGLDDMVQTPPKIPQPGRPDGGLQPFLIRSLSGAMMRIYGQPLDDSVALLVSAALDLPEPLTREAIRPYLKGTGKISSGNR